MRSFLAIFLFSTAAGLVADDTKEFTLLMPNSKPAEAETYLCTPIRLDGNTTNYITGFDPQVEMGTAHHMVLFGCSEPGQREPLFSCGEMSRIQPGTKKAAPCASGQEFIYTWSNNAPALTLPPGVGFKVGGPGSNINYLVLQVHYASVENVPAEGDTSGVKLRYTNSRQPRRAGVYLLATRGVIPSRATQYFETACNLTTSLTLHPFAFRTHTHDLGRVVSGWKVSSNMEWDLIGKKDPQLPQMFYPIEDSSMTLTGGDTLAARCTMVSNRDRMTWVGPTAKDEMCNFYMMYWVEGKEKLGNERCLSVGPPDYTWGRILPIGGGLSNIPDHAASSPL